MIVEIRVGGIRREAEFYEDIAPVTVETIRRCLPVKGYANRWGDEIYFETGIVVETEENLKEIVEIGDIAYWLPGRAICIFFGKTPVSDEEIRPASPVNVFGKVKGDLESFKKVDDGEEVEIKLLKD
ncbi:MAG TPA: hypothetical protein EYP30_04655 [Archaeoglobaceae archaeon]|nr:hypothetical protein [Archaeoglobaceae archaeon]